MSVVVPVYRSAECLAPLADAVAGALDAAGLTHELILVNDGSPDAETWDAVAALCAARPEVVGIDLRRNFGQDNAILTGLRVARGRAVAVMDDDLQHDPADLPRLLARLDEGADVVYADFRRKRQAAWKNFGSWLNGKLAEWVLDKPPGLYLSPYKIMRRDVAELICGYEGPDPYVDGLLFQVTSRFAQVPAEHHPRRSGRSNYSLRRSIGVWLRLATGYSVRPLRLVTYCGFLIGVLGLLLAVVVVVYRLIYPERFATAVAGWASLMVSQLLLSSVRLVFLGVIGEYVGRMHTAVAGRKPQAVVRAAVNVEAPVGPLIAMGSRG